MINSYSHFNQRSKTSNLNNRQISGKLLGLQIKHAELIRHDKTRLAESSNEVYEVTHGDSNYMQIYERSLLRDL